MCTVCTGSLYWKCPQICWPMGISLSKYWIGFWQNMFGRWQSNLKRLHGTGVLLPKNVVLGFGKICLRHDKAMWKDYTLSDQNFNMKFLKWKRREISKYNLGVLVVNKNPFKSPLRKFISIPARGLRLKHHHQRRLPPQAGWTSWVQRVSAPRYTSPIELFARYRF